MPLPQPAAQDDTLSELLELINRQLTEKNPKVEKASAAVIDATIIQTAGSKQRQAETFAKKPFPRQPKPKHSFSAVFVSNIH